ncbi:uncharacterized protein GrlHz isoform X3 [Macrobrachium rosenbergii]
MNTSLLSSAARDDIDDASVDEEEDPHGFHVVETCILQRQSSLPHQSPVPSTVSSTLDELFTCEAIMITDGEAGSHNTVAVLRYVRERILKPRDVILSLLGFRDWAKDGSGWCMCTKFLNVIYCAIVVLFLCIGPVLQYNMCFKRDQGIKEGVFIIHNKTTVTEPPHTSKCLGNYLFIYIIPNVMFLIAYLMTCLVLRCGESETLQTLLERVYLIATCSPWEVVKHRRLDHIWIAWVMIGFMCLSLSLSSMILHLVTAKHIPCTIIASCSNDTLRIVFASIAVASLWMGDVTLIVGILLYCSQCHLLSLLLSIIRETLLQGAASLLAVKKQIDESTRFVQHLNRELGLIVGLMLCVTVFRAITGLADLIIAVKSYNISLFNGHLTHGKPAEISWVNLTAMTCNLLCWMFSTVVPLVMAAKVSNDFKVLNKVGSTLHARPFVYQLTPQQDIDSFLLYVTSLRLKAKILWIPIRTYFLVSFLMLLVMFTMVLGYLYF